MDIHIEYRPTHSLAKVTLQAHESIIAEAGALVGMSTNIAMQTQSGGMMAGLKRLFGGESFFRNTFTADGNPGEVLLAQTLNGDMTVLEMTSTGYYMTNSAFVASSPGVEIETKVGGFQSFFSTGGLFVLKASAAGPSQLLVGAFGGIEMLYCEGQLLIDTGHLVAWEASLTYRIGKSGSGWLASFLSGEGLACHFQGQGRIWIQSRNPVEYAKAVAARLPPRKG